MCRQTVLALSATYPVLSEVKAWRGGSVGAFTQIGALDEVAARQLGADRACYASRDALVCRVGQEEGGSLLAAYRH